MRCSVRLVFGVLGLVVVLATVGLLSSRQLQAVREPVSPAVGTAEGAQPSSPAQQSQPLQRRVADDVNRLMQQGPKRLEGAEE